MTTSKQIDDGGLAFPGKRSQQVGSLSGFGLSGVDRPTFADVEYPGMSLRDYFASKALPVLLAELYTHSRRTGTPYENIFASASFSSYEVADEMISARKEGLAP